MIKVEMLQHFLPSIASGALNLRTGKGIHVRQGHLARACGLHCVAMGLTVLGHIGRPAELTHRRTKAGAALLKAGLPYYFEGASAPELANLIESAGLQVNVSWEIGTNERLMKNIPKHVMNGFMPIVGWESRNGRYHHWMLVVGVEIYRKGLKESPTALLCLDPNADAPSLCAYNARLEILDGHPSYGTQFVRYETAQHSLPVALNEAVWLS